MKLTDVGEKEIIRRLASFLDIGDDAAYIKYGDEYLILSTDMIFEETHVLPGMSWEQVGNFIVSVNASDLAAMGAKPMAFLLSYGSHDISLDEYERLMRAIDEKCRSYGMKFAGGDTKQACGLTLAGFSVGTAKKPVLRSGAREGDILAVTGFLGDASLGVDILLSKMNDLKGHPITRKAMEPAARIKEGQIIGEYATSMTDISDSLATSLHEIAAMSSVGFRVFMDKIPVSEGASDLANRLKVDLANYSLYGGGDYELLFTIKEDDYKKLSGKIDVTAIGEVSSGGIVGVREGGTFPIERRGYEHFRRKK